MERMMEGGEGEPELEMGNGGLMKISAHAPTQLAREKVLPYFAISLSYFFLSAIPEVKFSSLDAQFYSIKISLMSRNKREPPGRSGQLRSRSSVRQVSRARTVFAFFPFLPSHII